MSVIITGNSHSCNQVYHTTVCRKVWQITEMRYITEEQAKSMGLKECTYCKGEFETKGGSKDLHDKLLMMNPETANAD